MNPPPVHRPSALKAWERTMQRASYAARTEQPTLERACTVEAVEHARRLLEDPPPGHEASCVAAFVVSLHNLADIDLGAGADDAASRHLCLAHAELLDRARDPAGCPALRDAAVCQLRETRSALLLYLTSHPGHPAATGALHTPGPDLPLM
jgi:hypothetical protein